MAQKLAEVKKLVQEFLARLGQEADVNLEEDKESQTIKVKIQTDNPGVLIGFHGKTLSSFQLILGLMVYRRLAKWQRVVVDVNDYREEQIERLRSIALNAAQRVKFSQEPAVLSPMTPFERRIIHMTLNDFADVETVSEGEGDQRRVVIRPKTKSQA